MKNYAGTEKIQWADGVKTKCEIEIPSQVIAEIERNAVIRYRRNLNMFIRKSNATPREQIRLRVAIDCVQP